MTLETDLIPFAKNYLKMGASPVFQWLRLPFPWQVVQISSLVRELIPHMFSCVPHFVTQELQQIRLPCPSLTISQNLLKLLCLCCLAHLRPQRASCPEALEIHMFTELLLLAQKSLNYVHACSAVSDSL